jgi:PST family polysaccharide transporter
LRLIRNLGYLCGAEVASKIITFAAVMYLARVAGPVGFGYLEFAAAAVLCAGLVVDQGFGPYGAREIAKSPKRTPALVEEIVLARFLLAAVAYLGLATFALTQHHSPVVTQLLLIYGLSLLVMPLLLPWVFQGHNRMDLVGLMQLIRQGVLVAVVFAFVRLESQLWIVAAAECLGVAAAAGYGIWMYHRQFVGSPLVGRTLSGQLFREGVPIGLSQLFWMVRMFGATVLVGMIAAPADVGFFGAAVRVLIAVHTFVWLYYFNFLPSLAAAWQRNREDFAAIIGRSFHAVGWITAAAGVMWVAVAPLLIAVVYGPEFAPAGLVLQILGGVCMLAALSGHYRYGLIAAGYQRAEMWASALGALAAITFVVLGYAAAGLAGVAGGLVLAELSVGLASWAFASRRLDLRGHVPIIGRVLAASAIALGVMMLLPSLGPGARLALGLLVVATLAVALDSSVRDACRQVVMGRVPWIRRPRETKAHEAAW